MLETGTKERSWRKLVSEVRSCSRREAFQSFFTVDVLPGCRPAELHALLGRLRGVDKSLSALELAPPFLYSLFHSNSARITLKMSSAMAFGSFVPRTL